MNTSPKSLYRRAIAGVTLAVLVAVGCHKPRKTTSVPNTTDYAVNLESIVAKPQLAALRWPNYSDYQPLVKTFYEDRNYEIAWLRDLKPTSQTTAFIAAFTDAGAKGLNPEDYDASRWPARLAKVAKISASQDGSSDAQAAVGEFDAAMTVCVMRYISDLRIGRVNPQHFNFNIDVAQKKYDLAEFISDNAVDAPNVPSFIQSVEPDSQQYRATETALAHYLDLARMQEAAKEQSLPDVPKSGVSTGGSYAASGELQARLQLEGDLPGDFPYHPPQPAASPQPAPPPAKHPRTAKALAGARKLLRRNQPSTSSPATPADPEAAFEPEALPPVYTAALAAGVKSFQHRHGLTEDGKLTPETVAAINVPLTARVIQLQDSLERWRWLPNQYVNAPLMVNLPEFVLRGFSMPDHKLEFTMRVVVGKVVGEHYTPVFVDMMRYMVFRPYWNVPVSIARAEIAPKMRSNAGYLGQKNFEAVDFKGNVLSGVTAQQVAGGQVMVREKPGPGNSLGLVKFMFPNKYNIYLHSTPAVSLFERTRRDFSHGCIRVQQPEDLAAWILKSSQTTGDWDAGKVRTAMNSGPNNRQVNLKTPLPIVIFYLTAVQSFDGHTHFFNDLYGYDQQLQQVISHGPPYPVKPDDNMPTPDPNDTASLGFALDDIVSGF